MMELLLVIGLLNLPFGIGSFYDPAPGMFQTRSEARNLECERISHAEAHDLYPGRVPEPPPRAFNDEAKAP